MDPVPPNVLEFIGRARATFGVLARDRIEMDVARIAAAVERAAEVIDPSHCFSDEWGAPLPGDPDAIEAYARRHQPRYLVYATHRNGNLVRLCDTITEVKDILYGGDGLARRFADDLLNIDRHIYVLGEVTPVEGPHPGREGVQHHECVLRDVTDDFF